MFLVGDIGGTNTRFALARREEKYWRLDQTRVVPTSANVALVIRQYLSDAGHPQIDAVACCGAGPLAADGRIQLTNADTLLDPKALAAAAGVQRATLVNDFAAVARAIPELPPDAFESFGDATPRSEATCLVIGPGTGLGVAQLVPSHGSWIVIPGEGGHADLAPVDAEQLAVWQKLKAAHGRVSAESVLSGPGLERLYAACVPGQSRRAPEIAAAAWRGESQALNVVQLFTRWLGSFAGNLALTTGAEGGVFVAGGIVPSWGEHFDRQAFRHAFVDKPPYREWLSRFPNHVVTYPQPGLYGLAALAGDLIKGSLT